MDLTEALNVLSAPDNIKSNFANSQCWRKSASRKGCMVTLLEWLNVTTDKIAQENIGYAERLKKNNAITRDESALIHEMSEALPKRFSEQVTLDEAKAACTKAFNAGFCEAVRRYFLTSPGEEQEYTRRNAALKVIYDEVTTLREFIDNNILVNSRGMLLTG